MTVLWRPSAERQTKANITRFMERVNTQFGLSIRHYDALYQWSIDCPAEFWSLLWDFADVKALHKGSKVIINQEQMPGAQWFPDARLNYAENLLRPCTDNPFQSALIFHGEQCESAQFSYAELYHAVSCTVKALQQDGVEAGDRVAAVLPNCPQAVIAMLATTSLGAVWSSCSPDFGIAAIIDRFSQIEPKVLLVCDGYYFNGKPYQRLEQIPELLQQLPSVNKTILVSFLDKKSTPPLPQIRLWSDYLQTIPDTQIIPFRQMRFNDPLYILYSSGTTGPPKCIVHSVGGTLLQHLKEHLLHVDLHPGARIFYFTTCGWMMWNWLVSALATASTLVLYDGSPLYPQADFLFDLVDHYQINSFGVSAKYIDTIRKKSINVKHTHNLESLQTILSTGSPLSPESFDYVYQSVKSDVCLSSISGGTDIISCFVLGCPILPVHRGEIQCRGLGMRVDIFDDEGHSVKQNQGELVCTAAFPSMPIGFWNDPQQKKYRAAYFQHYPGVWRHGDLASLTDHHRVIIYGRSDTVLNPAGVRIGTAEIYRQVEQLDEVLESLVIGHDYQGDCQVILFVVLRSDTSLTEQLIQKIKQHLRSQASPRHVPAMIFQVTDIPRTRSGKIVEQLVSNIINQQPVKNYLAVANPESLEQYQQIAAQIA